MAFVIAGDASLPNPSSTLRMQCRKVAFVFLLCLLTITLTACWSGKGLEGSYESTTDFLDGSTFTISYIFSRSGEVRLISQHSIKDTPNADFTGTFKVTGRSIYFHWEDGSSGYMSFEQKDNSIVLNDVEYVKVR